MNIVQYTNGNYKVFLDLDSGTKIRKNDLDNLTPEYPESMDIKITNRCKQGCEFCHENSVPDGEDGDIMNAKFIDTLHPYTELAIGGGDPLEHPDLLKFLEKCQKLKLVPSMTIHQFAFERHFLFVKELINKKLIYGLGVSLVLPSKEFIEKISQFPNAVIHVINGVHSVDILKKLYDKGLKLLILGYKTFRRGEAYSQNHAIKKDQDKLFKELPKLVKHFNVVSFDNLALEQLDPKRLLSKKEWDSFYMGDDGGYTMYVDMVKQQFAMNSTTPVEKRHQMLDNIKDMFDVVRQESKKEGVK